MWHKLRQTANYSPAYIARKLWIWSTHWPKASWFNFKTKALSLALKVFFLSNRCNKANSLSSHILFFVKKLWHWFFLVNPGSTTVETVNLLWTFLLLFIVIQFYSQRNTGWARKKFPLLKIHNTKTTARIWIIQTLVKSRKIKECFWFFSLSYQH